MKTLDDYFADWEAGTFGYGYGTGEEHTIAALMAFLKNCPDEGCYNYETLEQELTAPVAWLLINILADTDVIEYGTSPRYAWLTPEGKSLKLYLGGMTVDHAVAATDRSEEYRYCFPDYCNCGDTPCNNPFWKPRRG